MLKSLIKRHKRRKQKKQEKLSPTYNALTFNSHWDIYFRLMDTTADTNEIAIQQMLESKESISFAVEENTAVFNNLARAFEGRTTRGLEATGWSTSNYHAILGFAQGRTEMLQKLLFLQTSPICFEEGFVRSVLPEIFAQRDPSMRRYANNISYRLDTVGPHFLPKPNVGIRSFLNNNEFSQDQRTKGKYLRECLVDKAVSKYNFARPTQITEDDYILVIDQAFNDMSVYLQGGDEGIFPHMLMAAIEENPGRKVAVKLHPEFRYRKTYLSTLAESLKDRIIIFADDTDIISLLSASETVYTFSSTVGLETIIRGKKAVVFGSPVYSGYGLSDDRRINLPSNRHLTVDELVFALYLQNMIYISPRIQLASATDW